jgi:uncharacterized protein YraI
LKDFIANLFFSVMILIFFYIFIQCDGKNSSTQDQKSAEVGALETSKEDLDRTRWIIAASGLRMRKGPGSEYDCISLIPYAQKVLLIEEGKDSDIIDGVEGKWCKVRWDNKEGWVFSAYLTKEKIPVIVFEKTFKKGCTASGTGVQQTTDGGYIIIGYTEPHDEMRDIYEPRRDVFLIKTVVFSRHPMEDILLLAVQNHLVRVRVMYM